MMDAGPRRGLYLLTPDEADSARLLARVEPLLAHATWLQYRNKAASAGLRAEQAALLQAACARAGVPLLVNDDPRLAAAVGAAGVHLGEDDGGIARAPPPPRAPTTSPSALSSPPRPNPAPAMPIPACWSRPPAWACRWWR